MKVDKILRCKKCGDQHHFTYRGEFWMCKCNAIGFDAGDSYYCRWLGDTKLFDWIKK